MNCRVSAIAPFPIINVQVLCSRTRPCSQDSAKCCQCFYGRSPVSEPGACEQTVSQLKWTGQFSGKHRLTVYRPVVHRERIMKLLLVKRNQDTAGELHCELRWRFRVKEVLFAELMIPSLKPFSMQTWWWDLLPHNTSVKIMISEFRLAVIWIPPTTFPLFWNQKKRGISDKKAAKCQSYAPRCCFKVNHCFNFNNPEPWTNEQREYFNCTIRWRVCHCKI